ncbi:MAG: hypothetical protein QXF52_06630 [Thermoproteota archaeon]
METGFGWIKVRGERYEYDIVIHVNGEVSRREKEKSRVPMGHTPLSEKELDFLERENPKVVFIGSGQYGLLPVTENARKILEKYDVKIEPTPEILKDMEHEKRKYVAILHITC